MSSSFHAPRETVCISRTCQDAQRMPGASECHLHLLRSRLHCQPETPSSSSSGEDNFAQRNISIQFRQFHSFSQKHILWRELAMLFYNQWELTFIHTFAPSNSQDMSSFCVLFRLRFGISQEPGPWERRQQLDGVPALTGHRDLISQKMDVEMGFAYPLPSRDPLFQSNKMIYF